MKKIKLVLSGSGTLYPVHVGAVKCLIENGYEIEELCGVSGGAIVAAGLASGYDIKTLIKLVKKTLPGKNNLIDPSLWSLFTKWGLIKGEKIEAVFEKSLVKTMGDVKIPLKIVVTNVNTGLPEFFSAENNPGLSLARAVRASMAIPFVFCPVKIDNGLYVDGGWVSNFPVDVFGDASNTVGFRFEPKEKKYKNIRSIKDYIPALLNASVEANMKEDLEDASGAKIVRLKTENGIFNFGMTDEDVDKMMIDGFSSVQRAIDCGRL